MAEKKINPLLKTALDLGPVLLFFLLYFLIKDRTFTISGAEYSGFILVTAFFVPLIGLTTYILYRLTGKLAKMQIVTLVLVIIFGGLTVYFNDERFFKMKPTIIYLMFGGVLGFGLLRGESYLKYVMEELMPLQDEGWMKLTRRLTVFFFALAVANEVIWRMMSTESWVTFKTFGLSAALFLFFMAQGGLFTTYALEEDEDEQEQG